jgi:hypothetical protein
LSILWEKELFSHYYTCEIGFSHVRKPREIRLFHMSTWPDKPDLFLGEFRLLFTIRLHVPTIHAHVQHFDVDLYLLLIILIKLFWENKNIITPWTYAKIYSITTSDEKESWKNTDPNMIKSINGSNCLRRIDRKKRGSRVFLTSRYFRQKLSL